MKAKDWAVKLSESPDTREETLKGFVEEIGTVAKQRGGSLSAIESAVREQRAKWQAVCRECPSVDAAMFQSILETYGPDYKKAEETARAQAANRGQEQHGSGAGRKLGSQSKKGGRSQSK